MVNTNLILILNYKIEYDGFGSCITRASFLHALCTSNEIAAGVNNEILNR